MNQILIKEIIVGIILGVGICACLTFMLRGAEKIKKHQEETGKQKGTVGLPSIGLGILFIFITFGLIFYLSHKFGIEAIYDRDDSRVIPLLGSIGRFNWHVSAPAIAIWVIYAMTINAIAKRASHDQTEGTEEFDLNKTNQL